MTTIPRAEPNASFLADRSPRARSRTSELLQYVIVGAAFGIVIVKTEVVSWYRIQEMFRFQAFHMYGVLGSAMLVALISLEILKRTGARAFTGELIAVPAKHVGKAYRYWIGGSIFGIGWSLTGACPGPLFALIGTGSTVYLVVALAALVGTWAYGVLRPHLPQ